jgi:hypothetical protein
LSARLRFVADGHDWRIASSKTIAALPYVAKQSFKDKGVTKQELGHERIEALAHRAPSFRIGLAR